MPESSFRRFYRREEFLALPPTSDLDVGVLGTALGALALGTPIAEVRATEPPGDGAVVEWKSLPTSGTDFPLVDAAIAAFAGGSTTSQPFVFLSAAASTTQSATHVPKLDQTTPLLDAGTYQVIWNSTLRMQAVIANTGIEGKIRLTKSDGSFVEQLDSWALSNGHAFNGAITFLVTAGQTIRAALTFARLGASGTAEISGVRVSLDKIG